MAFEANNFNVARKLNLPKSEVSVECSISVGEEINKVLSLSAQPSINSYEVTAGVVSYVGVVDVCLVYLNSNGEIGKVNSICPFSSKINNEIINNGQKATIRLTQDDCDVENMGSDNVKVLCSFIENVSLVDNSEIKSIKCVDDFVCTKEENIKVVNFIGEANSVTNINSQLSTRDNIKRVILTESQVLVKDVTCGNNFVSVSGDVITRVLYLTENDRFESSYINDNFKEEIELEGTSMDSQIEAVTTIKRDGVNVTVEQEDKGGKINIEIPINISAKAYGCGEISVIKDIYSTKNQLNITTESFNMSCICNSATVEGKIDGSLTLDEDRPRVDKIMFIGGNSVAITNSTLNDGEITIEGIAKTNVIYLNDEENVLNAVTLEVPFVISDKMKTDSQDGYLFVDAIVTDVDVIVKKGRELFYDARIKASVSYCADQLSGVITEVTPAEELEEKDYGLELVYAKAGQTAWDIAKEIKVKEDMILLQNPDIIFPLEENKNIVLFYQKTPI